MITEIILTDQTSGQQYSLDLDADTNLLLTFQCGDARKLLSTKSSYSKTVSINGTSNNNQAFSNLFDIRNYSDFNPNLKCEVQVKSGGVSIFEGYLKVDSIKITNRNLISYECTMYNNVADLFTELSSLKLNQLSFQEFNHVYSTSAVTGSWETFVIYNGQETTAKAGFGYVYPYVDLASDTSLTNIKYTEFFKPCFYAKTVLDKVFAQTDYTYKSDFLNSDYFKSLIIVPSPDSFALCAQTVTNAQLWASQEPDDATTGYTVIDTYVSPYYWTNFGSYSISGYTRSLDLNDFQYYLYGNVPFPNTAIGGRYDYGHNFNVVLSEYTVPVTGFYNITANFNIDTVLSNSLYADGVTWGVIGANLDVRYVVEAWIKNNNTGISTPLSLFPAFNASYGIWMDENGYVVGATNGNIANFNLDTGLPYPIAINEGDTIYIVCSGEIGFYNISTGFENFAPVVQLVDIAPSDIKIQLQDNQMHEGMTWNFDSIISSDQCDDYILSLAKMFNLYFEFDSTQDNTLIIEPFNSFYDGNIIDWTYKLDRSNEIEIIPMSDITNERLHFLYRNDSDYWNNKYQTENISTNKFSLLSQLTYGEYTWYFDNDFIDQASEDKIDLIFAPTPLVQDFYYTNPVSGGTYSSSTKIISTAYQEAFDNTTGNITKSPLNSFAPRILFYNGLIPCDSWGMYDYNLIQNKGLYADFISTYSAETWVYSGFTDFPHNSLTEYPYAGHLDNPYTPNQDLNFNFPAEYFYARTAVTTNNLFNQYWFDAVQQMDDTSAKLMTAYFYLTTVDIQSLSFRNIIYLDGSYWIINQIIDYSPLDDGLTQVELLKLINYNQTKNDVTAKQQTINVQANSKRYKNLGGNSHNDSTIGAINTAALQPPTRNIITGTFNSIDPSSNGNIIVGDVNYILPNTKNALIVGSGSGLDSNTVIQSGGINSRNVNMIGLTGVISHNGKELITFNNGNVNIAGTTIQAINQVQAGVNEVMNEFPEATLINFISAGTDKVRGVGSSTLINIISAGSDNILSS